MTQPLEVECRIHTHFFARSSTKRLCPLQLPRIQLRLESFVALATAETKNLRYVELKRRHVHHGRKGCDACDGWVAH